MSNSATHLIYETPLSCDLNIIKDSLEIPSKTGINGTQAVVCTALVSMINQINVVRKIFVCCFNYVLIFF